VVRNKRAKAQVHDCHKTKGNSFRNKRWTVYMDHGGNAKDRKDYRPLFFGRQVNENSTVSRVHTTLLLSNTDMVSLEPLVHVGWLPGSQRPLCPNPPK
jgi:hypothetical protein